MSGSTSSPDDSTLVRSAAIRSSLAQSFDLFELHVSVHTTSFSILKVRDTNVLLDAIDPQVFSEDERLPYWADIWTSAYELARYCLAEAPVREKRVLELGCGVGLAGLAAARAGADVTLSDYEPVALQFAEYNALTNLTADERRRIAFMPLDWRSVPALEPFDVIIAADVVYERRNFSPLITLLDQLMKPEGLALFTEPGRTIGERFFAMLQEHGYSVERSAQRVHIAKQEHAVVRAMIRKRVTL